jgi:hypothetical protein
MEYLRFFLVGLICYYIGFRIGLRKGLNIGIKSLKQTIQRLKDLRREAKELWRK